LIWARPETSVEASLVLACVREPGATEPSELARLAENVRDWAAVLKLADNSRVTQFVLRALKSQSIQLPPATMRELSECGARAVARNMVVDLDLRRVAVALRDASIRAIALKGPGLARTIYEEPALRPYDDIDLCVQGADRDTVAAVLNAVGFSEIPRSDTAATHSRDFVAKTTQTLVEIHGDLLEIGLPPRCEPDRWCRASAIPGLEGMQMMGPEDQLVHLSFHAHKHGFNRLIWLKDVDLLVRNTRAGLDWDLVQAVSRREELRSSVWLALDFARAMLGTPAPPGQLRALGPAAATRVLYRLAWPPANVHSLKGHMRRRAVQFVTSESWRGMLTSAVFMGRRRERVRLFAKHLGTGASAP
jgi:Uncharacterised nucleotidyltransferase